MVRWETSTLTLAYALSSYLYQGIIVPASVTIPLAAGIAKYRYLEKSLKVIVLYLTVAGVVNAIAALLAFYHVRNLPLLHIYTVLELTCLGVFFYFAFDSKIIGQRVLAVTFIVSVFCIVNFLFLQSIYSFNSYTRPLEAIVLIVFAAFISLYKPVAILLAGGQINLKPGW